MDLVGKNFADATEVAELPLLREEVVEVGGFRVGREVTEPGWRWSEHARPTLGGEWCQDRHVGITVAGRWGVSLQDGRTIEYGAGDAFEVPAGHDSWTIGDEPCVTITWTPLTGTLTGASEPRCPGRDRTSAHGSGTRRSIP